MTSEFSALCDGAERTGAMVRESLVSTEQTLTSLEAEMAKLPFFVRGFVTSEVSRGSGQDLPVWTRTVADLAAALGAAEAAIGRARPAEAVAAADRALLLRTAERIEAERPRLEKLTAFMAEAPSKIGKVPPAILPPERRADFLVVVEHQVQTLRTALAAMPDLERSLRGLSGV